mmetsp:Transcript_78160/g.168990  ORF Transcript_78160/g.168990 Transcript_78160/m.168990 type:complete len:300 (-) Transcript_78160:46-945(-)
MLLHICFDCQSQKLFFSIAYYYSAPIPTPSTVYLSQNASCPSLSSCLFLLEPEVVNVLPQHREHESLHAVRHDLRLESPAQQTHHPVLGQHPLQSLWIGDGLLVGLLVHLDHADGVGAGVRRGGRAESDEGRPPKSGQLVVKFRQVLVQVVVHEEPGVVADEGRRRCGQSSVPEDRRSLHFQLGNEILESIFPADLHACLKGVHRHENDTEESSRSRGSYSLNSHREILCLVKVIKGNNHSRVCSSVSESGQRSLNQGREEASVESRDSTILVQCLERFSGGGTISILIVDGGSHPHQR